MTIIQIKRSANVAAPSTSDLVIGELAYSFDQTNNGAGAKLYIEALNSGGANVIHTIGGKYYTDDIDSATDANTASKLVRRSAAGNFTANVITATTFVGNISGAVTSAVIANTANALTTARDIGLAGDLTGNVSFDGSQNVTLTATIAANSVALGTDTTGNYLANVIPGTGLTGSGFGTEGATPTLTLATSGASAATYGGSATTPVLTVDVYGRITNAANVTTTVANTNITGNIIASQITSIASSQITGDIVLGTQTSGNYLANVLPGVGLNGTGFGTEGATPTLNLANTAVTAGVYGGTTNIPTITVDAQGRITSASNSAISTSFTVAGDSGSNQTIAGGDTLTIAGGTGLSSVGSNTDTVTLNLDNTAVTPSTYGGAASTAVFTVDQQGRLTAASNVTIAIPSSALTTDVALGTQTSGAYVANLVAGTGITLSGLGNEGTTPTITNSGVTSVAGTTNQITVSGGTGAVTFSLPAAITTPGSLTVTGDLIVNGTATTINTATVTVADPLVKFGNANPADSLDIGFFGQYTSSGEKFAGLFRDASDSGKFKLFVDLTSDPTTNVINTASYTVATLIANLSGGTVSGLTANIAVSDGGTGRGTLTNNAVIYGQGTSAVALATGTDGQVLQINSSGVPVFGVIDGGTY
jgi:hypothetical protein